MKVIIVINKSALLSNTLCHKRTPEAMDSEDVNSFQALDSAELRKAHSCKQRTVNNFTLVQRH